MRTSQPNPTAPEAKARQPITIAGNACLIQNDAAIYVDRCRQTLLRWAMAGRGPPFIAVGRLRLYPITGLDDHIAARRSRKAGEP